MPAMTRPSPRRPTAAPVSLKAQALALLARREHSRTELRTKLLRHARKLAVYALAQAPQAEPTDEDAASAWRAEVEQVLAWLQAQRYQSDERFAESRVHQRAQRLGTARLRQELAQHGVALSPETLHELQGTEWQRAQALWAQRYGTAAENERERARQIRFLLARGFSSDIVRKVVAQRCRAELTDP
jgi:regulatory protein